MQHDPSFPPRYRVMIYPRNEGKRLDLITDNNTTFFTSSMVSTKKTVTFSEKCTVHRMFTKDEYDRSYRSPPPPPPTSNSSISIFETSNGPSCIITLPPPPQASPYVTYFV